MKLLGVSTKMRLARVLFLVLIIGSVAATTCSAADISDLPTSISPQSPQGNQRQQQIRWVNDNAHLLDANTIRQLTQLLSDHEKRTTNQFVIVTVPSLGGQSIDSFGKDLGNKWGIGKKGVNNGVMLIVAPKERKVRIEVGLGLEKTLTDAVCQSIIDGTILPLFKSGNMQLGIVNGVTAILRTIEYAK